MNNEVKIEITEKELNYLIAGVISLQASYMTKMVTDTDAQAVVHCVACLSELNKFTEKFKSVQNATKEGKNVDVCVISERGEGDGK